MNAAVSTKEPNQASKKVCYGVARDLDGFPVWMATYVGSRPVAGPQEVHDITVPETENFIAAGITVHNCRNCGGVVCSNCSKHEFKLEFSGKNERVCDRCYEMLYQDWRSGSARSRQSVYLPKTSATNGKHA